MCFHRDHSQPLWGSNGYFRYPPYVCVCVCVCCVCIAHGALGASYLHAGAQECILGCLRAGADGDDNAARGVCGAAQAGQRESGPCVCSRTPGMWWRWRRTEKQGRMEEMAIRGREG